MKQGHSQIDSQCISLKTERKKRRMKEQENPEKEKNRMKREANIMTERQGERDSVDSLTLFNQKQTQERCPYSVSF